MKIGVIGGSGLYSMEGLENVREADVDTAFGAPSDVLVCGTLSGVEVVFLARHGRAHTILPSEINYRANILAMKQLGAERIIGVCAVGSFKEEMAPRDIVVIDQFVDRTNNGRIQTFFGGGIAAHISLADPVCPDLHRSLYETANAVLAGEPDGPAGRPPRAYPCGTYLNMEGPAFSTRAESFLYKSWGLDVIGMTSLSEAKLAREAEICYATMAMVTDYDCWHDEHESVSVEMIIRTLQQNAEAAESIIRTVLPRAAGDDRACPCRDALATAVITQPGAFAPETRERLDPLLGKYYPA